MLIPDTLFIFIANQRGGMLPINKASVGAKRRWKNKTPEEREAYRKKRSEIQKRVEANLSDAKKKEKAEKFRKGMQRYWDTVDEERKNSHIKKMSSGMKKAWDEADENFAPKIANKENILRINKAIVVESDLPRINDYSGVITESQMAELNG